MALAEFVPVVAEDDLDSSDGSNPPPPEQKNNNPICSIGFFRKPWIIYNKSLQIEQISQPVSVHPSVYYIFPH